MLHGTVSEDGPNREQNFPPFMGAGLLHGLLLVLVPPPQLLLHEPKLPHAP